ncbi:hypothetical protein Tco_0288788 [Tanacetum coccineum]
MLMTLLDMINPRWSVTTVISWDTLLRSVEHQEARKVSLEIKTTPRSKEGQFRNQDNTKKQGNNEDTSLKAMLVIDGVGFDWSDMAEEQVQTNMALMKQCDDLIVKLNQTEFTAATYKRGLTIVEDQLITYRKNEVLLVKKLQFLKEK